MKITPILEYFDTDYYNVACTAWTVTDRDHVLLVSHATRQAEYVVEDDDLAACACGRHPVLDFACLSD